MSKIAIKIAIDGVMTDPASVTLSDPTSSYGVRRADNLAVVVTDGTVMSKTATGTYEHTFADPGEGLTYEYSIEWVYQGTTYYKQGKLTSGTSPAGGGAAGDITLSDIYYEIERTGGRLIFGVTDSAGAADGSNLICSDLADYDNNTLANLYCIITSGDAEVDERLISASVKASGTITPHRVFSAQIASGVSFELHRFSESVKKDAINWAIKNTEHLFQEIRDTSTETASNTYAYDVPGTILGDPLQLLLSQSDNTKPYIPLMNWNYDELNHQISFDYSLPAGRTLRMVGKGRFNTLTTRTSTINTNGKGVRHVAIMALAHLLEPLVARAQGGHRTEKEIELKRWLDLVQSTGESCEVYLPDQTIKVPGWTFAYM